MFRRRIPEEFANNEDFVILRLLSSFTTHESILKVAPKNSLEIRKRSVGGMREAPAAKKLG
jgi:hypothetical protein